MYKLLKFKSSPHCNNLRLSVRSNSKMAAHPTRFERGRGEQTNLELEFIQLIIKYIDINCHCREVERPERRRDANRYNFY